jgi:glycerol-3-phosphate acyltransferase PlsY
VTTAILVLAGWICGSMPWGYWLVRMFRGADIRTQGSGNIGATNVWRVHGRRLGLPAVFLDTAKGFVPALVATKVAGHDAGVLTGAAAMLGHFRPLFLGFRRGGKVVATTGGAFLGIAPIVGGIGAAVWLVVFALTRYASVASIASALTLPLWAWLVGYPWPVTAFAGAAGAAVLVLHRGNLRRLLRGEEPRFTRSRRNDDEPAGAGPSSLDAVREP